MRNMVLQRVMTTPVGRCRPYLYTGYTHNSWLIRRHEVEARALGNDAPYSMLTLDMDRHVDFRSMIISFVPVEGPDDTYNIETLDILDRHHFPIERTLESDPHGLVEPPSPRLLAIHRACCSILHFSGAGRMIQQMLGVKNPRKAGGGHRTENIIRRIRQVVESVTVYIKS